MKLKKDPKTGIYNASFKTAEGKTKTISTKCKDKLEAKKVVKESGLKDLEQAAKAGRLTREAIGHITTGKKLTVEKAVAKWGEWMGTVGKAAKTVANHIGVLQEWMADQRTGHLPPATITEKQVNDFINAQDDTKSTTRAAKLSALRSFFGLCAARGWSIGNPAAAVQVNMDNLSHDQKEVEEREPFNKFEVDRLVADCKKRGDTFWQFAIECGRETGLRLGDICSLEWDCFLKANTIVVHTGKRNRRVEMPISNRLGQLISEIPVHSDKYLFPAQREISRDPRRRAALSMSFLRLCRKLGIEGKSFHCLRHAAATEKFTKADKNALAKKLVDALTLEEIAKLLGHSSSKTTKGYVHE